MSTASPNRGRRISSAVVGAVVALLLSAAPARATTITYNVLNWMGFPGNIAVKQFDPANGTLTSVTIAMSGIQYADMRYENPTQNTFDVTTSWSSSLAVTDPFGAKISATNTKSSIDTVGPYDGTPDYDGVSGNSFYWSDTPSITNVYTDPLQLAFATGLGSLLFAADAKSSAAISSPGGNLWQLSTVATQASVWVTYEYEPAVVPEPATLALIATGLFGVAMRMRHKRVPQ